MKMNLTCDKPPAGWYCTRMKGHEGPCAAHPCGRKTKQLQVATVVLVGAAIAFIAYVALFAR